MNALAPKKSRIYPILTFVGVALLHLLLMWFLFSSTSASLEISSGGAYDMTEGAASGGLLKFVPITNLPIDPEAPMTDDLIEAEPEPPVVQNEVKKERIAVQVEDTEETDFQVEEEKQEKVEPEKKPEKKIEPVKPKEKPKKKPKKPKKKRAKKNKRRSAPPPNNGDPKGNAKKAGYGGKSDLAKGKKGEGLDAYTSAAHQGGYLHNPKPPYPAVSVENGEEGTVTLRVMVETNGRPSSVEIVRSSGYRRLDRSALKTVRSRYKFRPATRFGQAIRSSYTFKINFSLR